MDHIKTIIIYVGFAASLVFYSALYLLTIFTSLEITTVWKAVAFFLMWLILGFGYLIWKRHKNGRIY